jgi:hypothetical protein
VTGIEVQRDTTAPATALPELVAEAVAGAATLVVRSDAEAKQARRIAVVLDAIRAAG